MSPFCDLPAVISHRCPSNTRCQLSFILQFCSQATHCLTLNLHFKGFPHGLHLLLSAHPSALQPWPPPSSCFQPFLGLSWGPLLCVPISFWASFLCGTCHIAFYLVLVCFPSLECEFFEETPLDLCVLMFNSTVTVGDTQYTVNEGVRVVRPPHRWGRNRQQLTDSQLGFWKLFCSRCFGYCLFFCSLPLPLDRMRQVAVVWGPGAFHFRAE